MRKLYFLFILIGSYTINSCIKHEVIPAPTYSVDLSYSFSGVIDGQSIKFTADSVGYFCLPTQEKNLVSPPQLSSAIYYTTISSVLENASIKIGLGQISWDRTSGDDPSLDKFKSFFTSTGNAFPKYKDDCSSGFNVTYTDGNGSVYKSHENSINYQDVKFTNIKQDSDETGDYSKYSCTFNCYVYYDSGTPMTAGKDSLKIQMGKLKGWFKK